MQFNIGFSLVLLSFLLNAQAKPTFDKMAEVLLNVLDDRPHYTRPVPHYAPVPIHPAGPIIQEGYDHGYDYYYGGGGGGHSYGNSEVHNNPYAQAPPVYGYYPRPVVHGPVKGNYYGQPQYQHPYAPTGPTYGHGYGRSAPAEAGGYKQHGY